jgi:hypothetical protein
MSDKWTRPTQAPPPLFVGDKEKDLVKQVNDEIIERVVGQQILYFSIDLETTDFHPVYGEALEKNFYHPVRVYALVEFQGVESEFMDNFVIDKSTKLKVFFHKRRLTEDQNLFVREGDYIRYGDIYYEIVKTIEPKLLYGQVDSRFEIQAECIRARKGVFEGA